MRKIYISLCCLFTPSCAVTSVKVLMDIDTFVETTGGLLK